MLLYCMETWSILRSFVIFYGHLPSVVRGILVYLFPFWYFVPRKIWQPWKRQSFLGWGQGDQITLRQKRQKT
jgi:hypothetical protein